LQIMNDNFAAGKQSLRTCSAPVPRLAGKARGMHPPSLRGGGREQFPDRLRAGTCRPDGKPDRLRRVPKSFAALQSLSSSEK
jgi:hypothetical protein